MERNIVYKRYNRNMLSYDLIKDKDTSCANRKRICDMINNKEDRTRFGFKPMIRYKDESLEIKSCWRCGGSNVDMRRNFPHYPDMKPDYGIIATCQDCGVSLPHRGEQTNTNARRIVKLWNARVEYTKSYLNGLA